jgi:hypothetical protein
MYNIDTELLFPPRVIPALVGLRGKAWQVLVDQVIQTEDGTLDRLAFILVMVRLNSCASCSSDSFRAMQGCTACARQTIKRYRGSDKELVALYESAKPEIEFYLRKNDKGAQ